MVQKIISFLNLLDAEGKLSITNLAMFTILIKVAVSPFEWASAVTLFCVCANYAHKRSTNSRVTTSEDNINQQVSAATQDVKSQLEGLTSQVSSLVMKVGLK
jgi:hypothetical protein